MKFLKRISRNIASAGVPSGKKGARAYAVGDIHGRLDLLNALLRQIEHDVSVRESCKTYIIFLGDLIDRGPASAQVVERLRLFRPNYATPVFLMGNHEEVFLRLLGGGKGVLESWLKFGGAECARSYDLDPHLLGSVTEASALQMLREAVPSSHRAFLNDFGDTFSFGDYLFVHAGIRPGLHVNDQTQADLRWIREPFLSDTKEHGCIVVHGHTVSPEVQERKNRIGIDTGAYKTGILSALAVQEDQRWLLATARQNDAGESSSSRRFEHVVQS